MDEQSELTKLEAGLATTQLVFEYFLSQQSEQYCLVSSFADLEALMIHPFGVSGDAG